MVHASVRRPLTGGFLVLYPARLINQSSATGVGFQSRPGPGRVSARVSACDADLTSRNALSEETPRPIRMARRGRAAVGAKARPALPLFPAQGRMTGRGFPRRVTVADPASPFGRRFGGHEPKSDAP